MTEVLLLVKMHVVDRSGSSFRHQAAEGPCSILKRRAMDQQAVRYSFTKRSTCTWSAVVTRIK